MVAHQTVAGLSGTGDGFIGAGAPASTGSALEHRIRGLATQFARQNEQCTLLGKQHGRRADTASRTRKRRHLHDGVDAFPAGKYCRHR